MRIPRFALAGLLLLPVSPQEEDPLTPLQRAWLAEHPVLRLAPTGDYQPAEFLDADGEYRGFSADVIQRIEDALSIEFQVVQLTTDEMLRREPELMGTDVVPLSVWTPERSESWSFTTPYLEFPAQILVRKEVTGVSSLEDLHGQRVAVVEGYAVEEFLRRAHPQIEVLLCSGNAEGIESVAFGANGVAAFVSDLPVAMAHMGPETLGSLRLAGETGFTYRMGIAVRKDWPVLVEILQRGLDLVTEEELRGFHERWFGIERSSPAITPSTLLAILTGLAAVALAFGAVVWWNRELSRRVDVRTHALREELEAHERTEAERQALEVQLLQSQKMEAVGRLAGGVAHDFNNLLTVIRGYGETLAASFDEDDEARADADEIVRAANRATELTQQLLTFSRHQPLKLEEVQPNELVRETKSMLERLLGADVLLEVDLDPGIGWVRADSGQLQQVLVNLAVNGRDAMPDGGNLRISTRRVTHDGSENGPGIGLEPGEYVRISTRDAGRGMDAATMSRVFDPFFTTKENGTGLGLSTVFGIVQRSQGKIVLESAPGHGSTFHVYLPRLDHVTQPEPAIPRVTSVPPGDANLLLVEDDAGVRRMMRLALERDGYRIHEVADGMEAIEHVEAHDDELDLIVTDVLMPRVGGRELALHLGPSHPGLKWLFTTGYVDEDGNVKIDLPRDAALLPKPFSMTELREEVRKILASS